jgi:hypothetical protein
MEILISHWHCILPAAAILMGLLLMNRKPKGNGADAQDAKPLGAGGPDPQRADVRPIPFTQSMKEE